MNNPINIILYYKPGGDFDIYDIKNIECSLKMFSTKKYKLNILSDDKSIATTLVDRSENKWWPKVEIFKFTGPCLYLDLDACILGNIDSLFDVINNLDNNTVLMVNSKSYYPEFIGSHSSSVVAWNGNYKFVYDEFTKYDMWYHGDQIYIYDKLIKNNVTVNFLDDYIVLYDWRYVCLRGLPDNIQICNFFGEPRPRSLGLPYWGRHLIS